MPRLRQRITQLFSVALILAQPLLLGCSGSESDAGSISGVSAVPTSPTLITTDPSDENAVLPSTTSIDEVGDVGSVVSDNPAEIFLSVALGPASQESAAWNDGVQVALDLCAQRSGFPAFPKQASLFFSDAEIQMKVARLRFDSSELISTYGYFWPQPTDDSTQTSLPQDVVNDCQAPITEAIRALGEPPDLVELDEEIADAAKADTSLNELRRQWQECMAAAGYPGLEINRSLDPASDTVAVAMQDSACRVTVGFVAARIDFQRLAVSQWLDSNPTAVADARRYWASRSDLAISLAGQV